MQGELTALRGRLEPLAGAWVGRASAQFAQLMVRWDTDARSLNQALGGIGQAIDGVARHLPAAGRRSGRRDDVHQQRAGLRKEKSDEHRIGDQGHVRGARGGPVGRVGHRVAHHEQLEDLRRFLAPMVATWQGAAAQDYQVRQKQWDTAAADLTAVLAQIGVALGAANDGYRQAEHANAARWR